MMKLFISILMIFLTTHAVAQMNRVKDNLSREVTHWQFLSVDDGMIFLLGPESKNMLFIKVHKTLANGFSADPLTVYCNNSMHHLSPGSSIKCYGNMSDTTWMSIAAQDFKNGAEGIYTFIPKSTD